MVLDMRSLSDKIAKWRPESGAKKVLAWFSRQWNRVWWRMFCGYRISVPWPHGPIEVEPEDWRWFPNSAHTGTVIIDSADPNDHYRPELERLCGRQGWDWDWQIANDSNRVVIGFRRGHEQLATYFLIRWAG